MELSHICHKSLASHAKIQVTQKTPSPIVLSVPNRNHATNYKLAWIHFTFHAKDILNRKYTKTLKKSTYLFIRGPDGTVNEAAFTKTECLNAEVLSNEMAFTPYVICRNTDFHMCE